MQHKYASLLLAGAASFSLAGCTSWLYGDQDSAAGGSTSAQPQQMSQPSGQQTGQQAAAQQELPPPVSERLVRNVQQQLQAKGMDPGPVDGIWGPQTQGAVEKFQREQNLQTTGQLNGPTLSALGITGEQAASAGGSASSSSGSASSGGSAAQDASELSIFRQADLNKNGALDRDEFQNAIKMRQTQSGGK